MPVMCNDYAVSHAHMVIVVYTTKQAQPTPNYAACQRDYIFVHID